MLSFTNNSSTIPKTTPYKDAKIKNKGKATLSRTNNSSTIPKFTNKTLHKDAKIENKGKEKNSYTSFLIPTFLFPPKT